MTITITRLYPSHAEAHAVVEALRAANVGDRNISVLRAMPMSGIATRRPQRILTRISTAGMTARRPRLAERALGPQSAARWAP